MASFNARTDPTDEVPAARRGSRTDVAADNVGAQRGYLPVRLSLIHIFHLELAIEFLDSGGTNVIGFFLTPVDDETVRIYSSLWRDDLGGSEQRMRDAIDFEVAVVNEDLELQSQFEVLALPLDITAEIHTRADKTTVELRRILRDFVGDARSL